MEQRSEPKPSLRGVRSPSKNALARPRRIQRLPRPRAGHEQQAPLGAKSVVCWMRSTAARWSPSLPARVLKRAQTAMSEGATPASIQSRTRRTTASASSFALSCPSHTGCAPCSSERYPARFRGRRRQVGDGVAVEQAAGQRRISSVEPPLRRRRRCCGTATVPESTSSRPVLSRTDAVSAPRVSPPWVRTCAEARLPRRPTFKVKQSPSPPTTHPRPATIRLPIFCGSRRGLEPAAERHRLPAQAENRLNHELRSPGRRRSLFPVAPPGTRTCAAPHRHPADEPNRAPPAASHFTTVARSRGNPLRQCDGPATPAVSGITSPPPHLFGPTACGPPDLLNSQRRFTVNHLRERLCSLRWTRYRPE